MDKCLPIVEKSVTIIPWDLGRFVGASVMLRGCIDFNTFTCPFITGCRQPFNNELTNQPTFFYFSSIVGLIFGYVIRRGFVHG